MKKYIITYKNALNSFLQYRLNLGLLLVSHTISFSGLLFLWIAVYDTGQSVGTYTLGGILMYYVVLIVVRLTVANGVGMGFGVVDQINEGVITNYLLKPYSYKIEMLMRQLAEATINIVFVAPILAVIAFLGRHVVSLPSPRQFLYFFGALALAAILYFFIYFLAALSSFWVVNGRNVIYATLITSGLINGSLLPLDLFPGWFQTISTYLPFQYLAYVPIQLFLGRTEHVGMAYLGALIWVGIFAVLVHTIWRLGVKKFEAVGI
jgi:ABC-2 type transport system permease protein